MKLSLDRESVYENAFGCRMKEWRVIVRVQMDDSHSIGLYSITKLGPTTYDSSMQILNSLSTRSKSRWAVGLRVGLKTCRPDTTLIKSSLSVGAEMSQHKNRVLAEKNQLSASLTSMQIEFCVRLLKSNH